MRVSIPALGSNAFRTERGSIFPDAGNYIGYDALRNYVEQRLIQLAENDELYLTEVYNQGTKLSDMAGDVILGRILEPGSSALGRSQRQCDIPDLLRNYRVKLEAIEHTPSAGNEPLKDDIRWKRGRRHIGNMVRGTSPDPVAKYADEWILTDATEVEVTADKAWIALRQFGKWVARAKTSRQQGRKRKFREVPPANWHDTTDGRPDASTTDLTTKQRRGRPRAAEATA